MVCSKIMFFIKTDFLANQPVLRSEHANTSSSMLAVIHPRLYDKYCDEYIKGKTNSLTNNPSERLLRIIPNRLKKTTKAQRQ